jgi:hypothetical protein
MSAWRLRRLPANRGARCRAEAGEPRSGECGFLPEPGEVTSAADAVLACLPGTARKDARGALRQP